MTISNWIQNALKDLFGKRRDQDLDDELTAFADELTQRYTQLGLSSDEVRNAVLRDMGSADDIKTRIRSMRRAPVRKAVTIGMIAVVCFFCGAATLTAAVRWGRIEWFTSLIAPQKPKRSTANFKDFERAHRRGPLRGIVLDESRQPLQQVRVTLLPTPNLYAPQYENLPQNCITDDWGKFYFTSPPLGVYRLYISGPGQTITFNGEFDPQTQKSIGLSIPEGPKGSYRGLDQSEFALNTFAGVGYDLEVTTGTGVPKPGTLIPGALTDNVRMQPSKKEIRLFNYQDSWLKIIIPNSSIKRGD